MDGFEILDHTADVGIRATGRNMAEAFANVARGMFSLVADLDTIRGLEFRQVVVDAPDQEALVVNWLNELIYLFETEGLLFSRFDIQLPGPTHLRASCTGERVDPQRHHIKSAIKAATYHGLEVARDGQWHIQVILDI